MCRVAAPKCGPYIVHSAVYTSSIVQFIFYFWSFEISRNILRNQKNIIGLDPYILTFKFFLTLFRLMSVNV